MKSFKKFGILILLVLVLAGCSKTKLSGTYVLEHDAVEATYKFKRDGLVHGTWISDFSTDKEVMTYEHYEGNIYIIESAQRGVYFMVKDGKYFGFVGTLIEAKTIQKVDMIKAK